MKYKQNLRNLQNQPVTVSQKTGLKFWLSISKILQETPDHYISKLVTVATNSKSIKKLQPSGRISAGQNIAECRHQLSDELKATFEIKIRAAENDADSRLGTYLLINPSLSKPVFEDKLEFQRVCVSRYRTGSDD